MEVILWDVGFFEKGIEQVCNSKGGIFNFQNVSGIALSIKLFHLLIAHSENE